jgi:hypothetical protein
MPNVQEAIERVSPRLRVRLPVLVGGRRGVTRDLSGSGVYLELDDFFLESKDLTFSILLPTSSGDRTLAIPCRGEVLRVEPDPSAVGVAVRFSERCLEDAIVADVLAGVSV